MLDQVQATMCLKLEDPINFQWTCIVTILIFDDTFVNNPLHIAELVIMHNSLCAKQN
jgi:hypothetical protein